MSANEFRLPDVGEGLTEAEIVAWHVKVGDEVAINDVLVEIETAKSIVELPSPFAGAVTALLVEVGQTVEVGTPIIRIGEDASAPVDPGEAADAAPQPIDTNIPPAGNATLVGYGPKQRELRRRARKAEPPPEGREMAAVAAVSADSPAPGRVRALAKPLVRRLARDLGVDLTAVAPTGPKGTVSKEDLLAAVAGAPDPQAAVSGSSGSGASGVSRVRAGERETREPIKGVRKQMASAMVSSAFTAPHVTEWVDLDVTATLELVERLRQRREFAGVKVSPLLVIARASLLALRRAPLVNSTWDEAAGEVVIKNYVNLGIAADTPRGLLVPNVKDADTLSLVELARALEALTGTAREGRTQPAALSGGSFTITNVGVFGVDGGTPIINPGESAILCAGAIGPRPWVVDGAVVPRQVMTLTLSFDHRHIDGATGSRFLADVAALVSDPGLAML